MERYALSMLVTALLVTSLVAGIVTATPPRSASDANGLSENESVTLWSRDTDSLRDTAARRNHTDSRTAISQLATGTDITFRRPPATAGTWTRNDFEDLEAGGSDTSVYPPHASLEDGVFIEDAHATVFAIQPSTRGHLGPDDTPLYIAPNGTMRGFVDYRVSGPHGGASETSTEWSLATHEISEVRLRKDSETIARTDGSHTPTLRYRITDNGSATLTLEAEITLRLKKTTQPAGDSGADVDVEYRTETRTVSDSIRVVIYNLSVRSSYATYPDGDTGVAIAHSQPWQGFTLTTDQTAGVRGVWRFYTARDTNWDTLVRSSRTDSVEVTSDAVPVYVHAYPSGEGTRANPVRDGPGITIIDTWGVDRPSPNGTIGENVTVNVVQQSYTATSGVVVRANPGNREALRITGIVRGVNASVGNADADAPRQLRRSSLSAEVLRQTQSEATLRIVLRDATTGAPIVLNESTRHGQIDGPPRTGVITIADRTVETNASGVATVTLTRPGIYTVRYHPGPWVGHDPAYVGDTATARWHPLGTIDGWVAVLFEAGWLLIPFVVMFYAGRRLLRMLGPEDLFQRHP